jgi:heat shock protein HslJ
VVVLAGPGEPPAQKYRHRGMSNLVGVRLLVVSSTLIALAACGQPDSGLNEPGTPSTSYRGTWQLISGRGPEGEVPLIGYYRITLQINRRTLGGTAACNRYGGDVAIVGGSFEMQTGAMTAMACRADVMESEAAYLAALGAAETIAQEGNTLILAGDATELRFELLPPIPTSELTDTRWELESLISGQIDDSATSSAASAELLINSDGTVTGSTGCRELHGEWIEDGDEILFATFGAEGDCPEELQEQDGHVVGVLGDGFTVEIDGDQLTVLSRGGLGLTYRASR